MASALDLAGVLRALEADVLATRLRDRTISRPAAVKDAFDLADALLDRSSVRAAVSTLDRIALLALRTITDTAGAAGTASEILAAADPAFDASADDVGAALERLAARFLVVIRDGRVEGFESVAATLDDEPDLTLAHLAGTLPPVVLEAVDDSDRAVLDAASAERVFSVVIEAAEIVRAVTESPARELARGGLALPENRRLAEAARIDVGDVAPLLRAAEAASLVELGPDGWRPGSAADAWLLSSWADRWAALVSSWIDSLPPEIRTVLAQRSSTSWGEPLRTFSEWFFPAGGAWIPERLQAFARGAELLGLTAASRPTSAAAALLGDGVAAATEVARGMLPEPIETVYLQHDLTVVAPGPLAPAVDARLRMVADVESAGLAATYRINEAKIQSALSDGESAESLRAFLTTISSTGIPQPVDYLLTETAERHGRYRVAPIGPGDPDPEVSRFGAVSRLRADESALVDTAQVDQSLRPLSLQRSGALSLLSRLDAEAVYWALVDARYPVLLEGVDGQPTRPTARARPRRAPSAAPADPIAALVDRVVSAGAPDTDTERAWIARQLDTAVKARMTVLITVAMPDGTTSELLMEPTGVGGGRVRGRDRRSDIERTLPLSSIVGVATP